MEELLILVNEHDDEVGVLDKHSIHKTGALHRAFSVFVFNSDDELLLQQRADGKYHSAGLWSNTCCSHPRSGEKTPDAIDRRLKEEMDMLCEIRFGFSFIYKVQFENGLIEHELDHVYFSKNDDLPNPDPKEVKDWKYMSLQKLEKEITSNPDSYSGWLKICFPKVLEHFDKTLKIET